MRLLRSHPGEEQRQASVDLTAMVDVVFLLIIFFLMVSELSDLQVAAEVDLPEAKTAAAVSRSAHGRIIVNVTAGGGLVVDGRALRAVDLALLIEREANVFRDESGEVRLQVLLRCDRDAPYRHVENILASCARFGVRDILFHTTKIDQEAREP